jgi:hypothetical protein
VQILGDSYAITQAEVETRAERSTDDRAELAQIEFRALKFFRGLCQRDRIEKTNDIIDRMRSMAILGAEIAAMSKPELIAKVEKEYKTFGPFLRQLAHTTADAKAFLDVIRSAEGRLAIALANVEGAAVAVQS